jgi:hypothetical protein
MFTLKKTIHQVRKGRYYTLVLAGSDFKVKQALVDRLAEFVVPYQPALETEAAPRDIYLYLQGLLSHLPGKNAEDIATFVDVQR